MKTNFKFILSGLRLGFNDTFCVCGNKPANFILEIEYVRGSIVKLTSENGSL